MSPGWHLHLSARVPARSHPRQLLQAEHKGCRATGTPEQIPLGETLPEGRGPSCSPPTPGSFLGQGRAAQGAEGDSAPFLACSPSLASPKVGLPRLAPSSCVGQGPGRAQDSQTGLERPKPRFPSTFGLLLDGAAVPGGQGRPDLPGKPRHGRSGGAEGLSRPPHSESGRGPAGAAAGAAGRGREKGAGRLRPPSPAAASMLDAGKRRALSSTGAGSLHGRRGGGALARAGPQPGWPRPSRHRCCLCSPPQS